MPRRRRRLPADIVDRPDSEVAEYLFGKRAKREFDRVLEQLNSPYLGNAHADVPLESASSR